MMKKKWFILLWALSAFFCGCSHDSAGTLVPQESSVTITLGTGRPVTRAGEEEALAEALRDGSAIRLDGSGNPDLYLAIASADGTIVSTYNGADTEDAERLSADSGQASIRFTNINSPGTYTVYAVANKSSLWGMNSTLGAATTVTDLMELTFNELTADGAHPTVEDGSAMPLSAVGTLSVSENLSGEASVDLLRCVAKIGCKFKNETEEELTLTDVTVTLYGVNPSQGYLFPHATDMMGDRYLSLSASEFEIPAGESTELYGLQTVFPSEAPFREVGRRYLCTISFTVGDDTKTFTDLPIHDKQQQDIVSLKRNQYLQIETRINKGTDISFNFEVEDWSRHTEEIFFH